MKFTPEDFPVWLDDSSVKNGRERIADLANAKLKEWLDNAPTVYKVTEPQHKKLWSQLKGFIETKQAKLVCIEEIK